MDPPLAGALDKEPRDQACGSLLDPGGPSLERTESLTPVWVGGSLNYLFTRKRGVIDVDCQLLEIMRQFGWQSTSPIPCLSLIPELRSPRSGGRLPGLAVCPLPARETITTIDRNHYPTTSATFR